MISKITSGKYSCIYPPTKGTGRIWLTSKPQKQMHVIKPRGGGGLKARPTACAYSRDGHTVACVCMDGSVQMWDHRKSYVNTIVYAR